MVRRQPTGNNKSDIYINIIVFFLAIHLFAVNSRLLAHLNIDSKSSGNVFDFSNFQLDNLIAMVISISYSTITALLILKQRIKGYSFILTLWFSIIDGLCVYIYYSVFSNFQKIGAIYYAVYTTSIIIAIGLHRMGSEQARESANVQEEPLTILRKALYKQRRKLKYAGKSVENDKVIVELLRKIKKMTSK